MENYIKSVLEAGTQMQLSEHPTSWVKIVEQIYRLNLDNRILNNLRLNLNEMIQDERGLVDVETFKKMFFTFFKGERCAYQIYEMLQPAVSVHWDLTSDKQIESSDAQATKSNKFIKI